MKKSLFCFAVLLFTLNLSAQEKGKIRVGLDAGLALPNSGFGLGAGIDVRYNIMDNLNVGVKFTSSLLIKDVVDDKVYSRLYGTAALEGSSLITLDYYFNKGNSIFSPYIGGGLGVNKITNVGLSASGSNATISSNTLEMSKYPSIRKFGGLIRGGFEFGHFRMGLDCYLIPRTLVSPQNASTILRSPTTYNGFLQLTFGFYFGGGHWKKINV